jgi:amino acid adenylation domain-containing protein
MSSHSPTPEARRAALEATVLALLAEQLAVAPAAEDRDTPFLELGANSLVLMEIARAVERQFGLRLAVRQFFAEVPTIAALAEYVEQMAPAVQAPVEAAAEVRPADAASPAAPALPMAALPIPSMPTPRLSAVVPAAGSPEWEDLFARQLQAVSSALNGVVAQQLAALNGGSAPAPSAATAAIAAAPLQAAAAAPSSTADQPVIPAAQPPLPPFKPTELKARGSTPAQRWHLEHLTARYTAKTRRSKSLTQQYRSVLADNRAAAGFRFSTKELTYPLIAADSSGSGFRDVDGNRYVDLTMGFGVNLFGHRPDFLHQALLAQLEQGIQIGPQTALAGEAATLFCDLTGQERVAFCNTGTEAVMAALRLARAVTGKRKIALFEGSYHGQFDGTLGVRAGAGRNEARPIAHGIADAAVADLLILDYGNPASLETLRAHRHELAAVLVEPVQSRRPELQPKAFLQALRALTQEAGIALVFDEMITGFRLHPRGAQGYFGIQADLSTYGKVLGGGMPIGAVAGRAAFLDAFDGGFWRYGDDSFPAVDTTFFAGTFNKHPLAMAAAKAVLGHLKQAGPGLQENLNARSDAFFRRLDALLQAEGAPLALAWCGSQFRFRMQDKVAGKAASHAELFFHHLPEQGIFIWEGRNCFLSTAHGEEDLARVETAAASALEEMRGGGFLAPAADGPARPLRLPLTTAQRQLALQADLDDAGSRAYHVSLLLELDGPLAQDRLVAGLQALAARHDALRAHLAGPCLRILPAGGWPLETVSLAADALADWAAEAVDRPFDLRQGPLVRAHLAQVQDASGASAQRHRLLLVAHHIIVDGWSMGVLAHELGEWMRSGGQPDWTPAPAWADLGRRADFEARQQPRSDAAALAFEGDLPRLQLPTEWPRAAERRFHGERRLGKLAPAAAAALGDFARSHGMTGFVPLLAAWAALLARESAAQDSVAVLIGIPVAGRPDPEDQRGVGYVAHLLPLRLDVALGGSFAQLTQGVRDAWLRATADEHYPYAQRLEDLDGVLARHRDPARAPFVETVFNLDRAPSAPDFGAALGVQVISPPIRHAAYDLALNVVEIPGQDGFMLEADYNPALFEGGLMQERLARYGRLLDRALADPAQPLDALFAADEEEAARLLAWSGQREEARGTADNATASDAWTLFARSADQHAAAAALRQGEATLTYAQVLAQAEAIALQLHGLGVAAGDRVGLLFPRSLAWVASILAAVRLGAVYVPLDPAAPAARLATIAGDARLTALVGTDASLQVLADPAMAPVQSLPCLRLDPALSSLPPQAAGQSLPPAAARPDAPAYLLYTSGSTGTPKGVLIGHEGVAALALAQARAFGIGPDSRILPVVSPAFDVASGELFTALAAGACLVLAESVLPDAAFVALLERERITHCQLPAAVLAAVPASASSQLPELRCLVAGGEACPPALAATWSVGRAFFNAYGPTETTVCVATSRVQGLDPQQLPARIPIGTPLGAARLYVLDAQGRLCPPGVPGELCIGGPGVAHGYWQRPELTAQAFRPNPFHAGRLYRSGDRVRWLADGSLDFLGRIDGQVKLRGLRIETQEIAHLVAQQPGIGSAAVVLRTDAAEPYLAAYYTVEDHAKAPDATQLRAALRAHLPQAMVPSAFECLEQLPTSSHGKIDIQALLKRPAPQASPSSPADAGAIQPPASELERLLADTFRAVLELAPEHPIDRSANFFDWGLHSLKLAAARERLAAQLGRDIPITDFFRYPSLAKLAAHWEQQPGHASGPAVAARTPGATSTADRAAAGAPAAKVAIAIIGMAGRFPGAASVAELWRMLVAEQEGLTVFEADALAAAGVPPTLLRRPDYVRARGKLDDIDLFDAGFFGLTPKEAAEMDPQHRLLLETAWETLEDAACDPAQSPYRIGVFAGIGLNTYLLKNLLPGRLDGGPREAELFELLMGNDKDFAPTRVAYKLGLTGPALAINSGCSSSLAAVAVACQQIRSGACEMALAGGVAVPSGQTEGYLYRDGGIDSADGHCRAFDAAAGGTVAGSGVGLVLLKRLDLALRDGDPIDAVIRGVGLANDGADKAGFTAPGIAGQARAIGMALEDAGVPAASIGYVEAHGTGTPRGDPIEIAALKDAFGDAPAGGCAIGSIKTNLGHLDTAAGVAGLIKTALAVGTGTIPASLHFKTAHPDLGLASSPFRVQARTAPWPPHDGKQPRRAGVSSFGIGGTNVHLVLEAPPAACGAAESKQAAVPRLLPLSARTPAALQAAASRLARSLAETDAAGDQLAATAWTLQTGRRAWPQRGFVVARTTQEAVQALHAIATGGDSRAGKAAAGPATLALLLPGQGSQHPAMARALYRALPVFRSVFDRCAQAAAAVTGDDLRTLLFAADFAPAQTLAQTRIAQPAVFSVGVALAAQLQAWGLVPQALIGHSLGELTAACIAGVFGPEEGAALVAHRGQCMQAMPPGAMLSIALPEQRTRELLGTALSLAAVNGREQCVVSGPSEAIAHLEAVLAAQGIACRQLRTAHAFHSPDARAAADVFARHVSALTLQPPRIPFISNVSGDWIGAAEATDPQYWVRQMLAPVRFADGLATLSARHADVTALECGPGRALTALAQRQGLPALAALPAASDRPDADDHAALLQAVGSLWCAGLTPDWQAMQEAPAPVRRHLPAYPFERVRHWVDAPGLVPAAARRPDGEARLPRNEWLRAAGWRPTALRATSAPAHSITALRFTCIAAGPAAVQAAEDLAQALRSAGAVAHRASLDAGQPAEGIAVLVTAGVAEEEAFLACRRWARAGGASQRGESAVWVLTAQAFCTLDEAAPAAASALLLGAVHALAATGCQARLIDAEDGAAPQALAALLLSEAVSHVAPMLSAWRGGRRWLPALDEAPLQSPVAVADDLHAELASGPVYWIVGGLGRIGLRLAEQLASRTPGARIVLTSRKTAPLPAHTPRLVRLRQLAADVWLLPADAAQPAAMEAACRNILARHARLDGVIYAAGLVGEDVLAPLAAVDRPLLASLLAAKRDGVRALEHALHASAASPRFVHLMSSVAAQVGGALIAAYAGANACLDALVADHNRRHPAAPWTALAWDGWADTDASATPTGGYDLSEEEAAGLYGQLLALEHAGHQADRWVLSPRRLDGQLPADARAGHPAEAVARQEPSAHPVRPAGKPADALSDPLEAGIAALWKSVLGIAPASRSDNFFALGGDSLTAVQLMSRLRETYFLELSVRALFEAPTLADLAAAVKSAQREAQREEGVL